MTATLKFFILLLFIGSFFTSSNGCPTKAPPEGRRFLLPSTTVLKYDVSNYHSMTLDIYSDGYISVYIMDESEANNFKNGKQFQYYSSSSCDLESRCCSKQVSTSLMISKRELWVGIVCKNLVLDCTVYDNTKLSYFEVSPNFDVMWMILYIGIPLLVLTSIGVCISWFCTSGRCGRKDPRVQDYQPLHLITFKPKVVSGEPEVA